MFRDLDVSSVSIETAPLGVVCEPRRCYWVDYYTHEVKGGYDFEDDVVAWAACCMLTSGHAHA